MKKLLFYFTIISCFILTGCTKEKITIEEIEENIIEQMSNMESFEMDMDVNIAMNYKSDNTSLNMGLENNSILQYENSILYLKNNYNTNIKTLEDSKTSEYYFEKMPNGINCYSKLNDEVWEEKELETNELPFINTLLNLNTEFTLNENLETIDEEEYYILEGKLDGSHLVNDIYSMLMEQDINVTDLQFNTKLYVNKETLNLYQVYLYLDKETFNENVKKDKENDETLFSGVDVSLEEFSIKVTLNSKNQSFGLEIPEIIEETTEDPNENMIESSSNEDPIEKTIVKTEVTDGTYEIKMVDENGEFYISNDKKDSAFDITCYENIEDYGRYKNIFLNIRNNSNLNKKIDMILNFEKDGKIINTNQVSCNVERNAFRVVMDSVDYDYDTISYIIKEEECDMKNVFVGFDITRTLLDNKINGMISNHTGFEVKPIINVVYYDKKGNIIDFSYITPEKEVLQSEETCSYELTASSKDFDGYDMYITESIENK